MEVAYNRWQNEYCGLNGDQMKWLEKLEAENAWLRRAVLDLAPDQIFLLYRAADEIDPSAVR